MSKNFDLIATVDIDIQTPIVDDTSFDNLLILGPAPKGEHNAPDVGAYSSIGEVSEAGFVVSGDGADPVGVAARVAFAQSPSPTTIYIALQKSSPAAVAAAETIAAMNAALDNHVGAYEMVGCSVDMDQDNRRIGVTLTVPFAEADGHGLFQALEEFVSQGYTATIDGITVEHYGQFKQTVYDAQLLAMKKGDPDISFEIKLFKEGIPEVTYVVTISYPDPDAPVAVSDIAEGPVDAPELELEEPAVTIQRALGMSGWYVLCTAGVDPAKYEDIAAFIETQEKMFCYTELDYFGAGEEGENASYVGAVYFRSMGVYGKEESGQALEDVPEANPYINVAFAAKWLNYESGSETSAFKTLTSVYPSKLTTTEMKALETGAMNYFITVGNKNITMNGMTRGGEWADVIRFRDWLKNDMQLAVVNLFVTRPKVPYTDSGIALVQNQMIASLKRGQNAGGIAEDEFDEDGNTIPGFVTSVPLSSSITASEKASRKLRNCKFKARLAGAIHFAELKGSLTYEL